ncbi:hydrogenase nickel incorporation protein HypB [Spongiibacter marinus]|uniref:hydrogenase nickel incorporation protein HypB n=1 Tax=Spongiibacter marinus TaxID=354246 RepID=UPI0035674677
MCGHCGCSSDSGVTFDGKTRFQPLSRSPNTMSPLTTAHHHDNLQPDIAAHIAAHGGSTSSIVQLEIDLLSKNNEYAERNRKRLGDARILSLNLLSSPGSGKTTLLERSIADLSDAEEIYVVEGDQATQRDATRIRRAGATAVQVNTGSGCHLEADMLDQALDLLNPTAESLLFIENVGNLVCPALFDLGENHRVVVLSVTEGEDKPLKYPTMFNRADLIVINKIDLLPYVDFDLQKCINEARKLNPNAQIISLSATTGEGLQRWYDWIQQQKGLLAAS